MFLMSAAKRSLDQAFEGQVVTGLFSCSTGYCCLMHRQLLLIRNSGFPTAAASGADDNKEKSKSAKKDDKKNKKEKKDTKGDKKKKKKGLVLNPWLFFSKARLLVCRMLRFFLRQ